MRRIFSMLLAVLMVLSCTVMAAPVQVSTAETTQEVAVDSSDESVAELEGNVTTAVKPGLNIFTGTTEPLTGENAEQYGALSMLTGGYSTTVSVADNPVKSGDKVLKWHIQTGINSNYIALEWKLPKALETLVGHNHAHVKYDFNKVVDLSGTDYTYRPANSVWIMHTSGNAGNVVTNTDIAVNSGWQKADKLLDFLSKSQTGTETTHSAAQLIRIQAQVNCQTTYKKVTITNDAGEQEEISVVDVQGNTVPTDFYFDNMMMVPAYEFKYYTPDGKTLLKTEYQAFDDNGNIITSITPMPGLYGDYYVSGWSTTSGGDAVDSYDLKNENVAFYAVDYTPAITVKAEGKLAAYGDEMTLTPVVIGALKDQYSVSKGTWTVEDSSIVSITTGKKGVATLKALKEGTTKATFTLADVKASYDVTVVFPYDADLAKVNAGESFDLDLGKYRAVVVTAKGEGTSTVKLSADGTEVASFDVYGNANDGVRDNYYDITSAVESSTNVTISATGNANITSVQLYTAFDPSFEIVINGNGNLLSMPAEEVNLSAQFLSDLEGVYDEGYTWTVTDADNVVSHKAYEDGTLKLRARTGIGKAIVTLTSNEDESYSVSKEIFVNVDPEKYGWYHDFLGITEIAQANVKPGGGENGNTKLTIVDDMLHLDKPAGGQNNGGVEPNSAISTPASQRYLVVNLKAPQYLKFYYRWDSVGFSEANTVSTNSASTQTFANEDGTVTYVFEFVNVPADAQRITGYMISLNFGTTADIVYYYTTSEKPIAPDDGIGYKWDFTTTKFGAGSGHHGLSKYEDGIAYVTMAHANIGGKVQGVQPVDATLSDGTPIIKLTTTGSGSINPTSIPTNLILNDYPYLWIKYKSTGTATLNLYLYDADSVDLKDGNTTGTQWDNKPISIPGSNDYTVLCVNLKDLGYKACLNTAFKGMMFAYRGKTTFNNVLYDEAGGFYYVVKPATYSENVYAMIDEIIFANKPYEEDPDVELNLAISLECDKEAITTDSGTLTITPKVYANQAISTDGVMWSFEGDAAKVKENEDGTLTLTATANGTITVTAASLEDPTVKSTVTINVSGQREKVATYEFKYYALGNSYLSHGYFNDGWPWPDRELGSRGMAASDYYHDYYALVQSKLTSGFVSTLTAKRVNYSALERVCNNSESAPITTWDQAVTALKGNAQYKEIMDYLLTEKPNIITVQLSENFSSPANNEVTEAFYDTVYGMIDECRPEASVVVVMVPFRNDDRTTIIKKYAQKYGFYMADMSDIPSHSVVDTSKRYFEKNGVTYDRGSEGWKYNPYLAWEQYPEYDTYRQTEYDKTGKWPTEFRTHPGDKGMELIATRMFEQFNNAVPAYLDATYIYIPTALTISGDDAITTLGGKLDLTAVPAESDATDEVVWSVDNEKVAVIDENGNLTAKNNGTVTVTAKCAYNNEIYGTKTITVSGQPAVYTLTYKAGTTDTVTGLPAADEYARDTYTLSSDVPVRGGYIFLGWATEENGNVVNTVNVDKDTDVYAVWRLAEGWHFDNDGDFEGIVFGGFNASVKDGVGTVLHYGDGISVSTDGLRLDSEEFDTFNFKMAVTDTTETGITMNVRINSDKGSYNFEAQVAEVGTQSVYSFDLSEVDGTITGFSIVPSAKLCTGVVDWIEFGRKSVSDDIAVEEFNVVVEKEIEVGDNNLTVEKLNAYEDVTFTGGGTVVIGEKTGDGKIYAKGTNIIYNGTDIDGYVKVELGDKQSETNVRYAEVDGYQYKLDDGFDVYGMIYDGNTKLVQIAEKTDENEADYMSRYYKVTDEGVSEITGLTNAFNSDKKVAVRTSTPTGIRFRASIVNGAKSEETQFNVTQYGYVVGVKRDLDANGAQLTLDYDRIAVGSCYISAENIDKVFDVDGDIVYFTGVVHGIPESAYTEKLVAKTFTRMEIDGEEFVVYGEPVVISAYDVAKALLAKDDISESEREFAEYVISVVEG